VEAERIGIFGGTFDPVHNGHLAAAVAARSACALDRVLLVVAGDPWQKRDVVVAPASLRLEMVEAAVAGVEGLEASDLEIRRGGASYTVDTVEALAGPGRELFLVVGCDVAATLGSWERVDDLRRAVTLVVIGRAGAPPVSPEGWTVRHASMPRLDIASTDLRERVAQGLPIDGLVPPAAIRVLREARLYTRP
jgi:nicotinate-nucleotide adenylyltransferase